MKLASLLSNWRSANDTDQAYADRAFADRSACGVLGPDEAHVDPTAWLAKGRYCVLLDSEHRAKVADTDRAKAWRSLEKWMAFVPGGNIGPPYAGQRSAVPGNCVAETAAAANGEETTVDAYFLDRYAVANADYLQFVAEGGYDQTDLWPEAIWPHVLQFVDESGDPGPRFWSQGRPPRRRERHPVVGVCWYEAQAYARWAGKRLPRAAEWERAGCWASDVDGRETSLRYPWGNAFSPEKANVWAGGRRETVEVDQYVGGSTPNGVYQLVGNVWEWVASRYPGPPVDTGAKLFFEQTLAEIRGGAFDTYFESQATCRFRTGQPFLFRGANVGFRCAVSADQLGESPAPSAFFNSSKSK